jgi:hypothetical protein
LHTLVEGTALIKSLENELKTRPDAITDEQRAAAASAPSVKAVDLDIYLYTRIVVDFEIALIDHFLKHYLHGLDADTAAGNNGNNNNDNNNGGGGGKSEHVRGEHCVIVLQTVRGGADGDAALLAATAILASHGVKPAFILRGAMSPPHALYVVQL